VEREQEGRWGRGRREKGGEKKRRGRTCKEAKVK